ncbi:MAG: hypothetical protein OXF41_20965 [bacterium]|nr:hypothetical protein [bacterium]
MISVDRGYDIARRFIAGGPSSEIQLHTTHPVVAQVWRGGARQARLAAFVKTLTVHPFDDGMAVGRLLALTSTSDVVDAHLVLVALRLSEEVLTGDPDDLGYLASVLGSAASTIRRWP